MRGANHIGKIVISNTSQNIKVPIRPAPRKLLLRSDVSYLIIEWLKGLCDSLTVYTARYGAKHVVVMSGSGYENKISQRVLNDLYNEGCHVEPCNRRFA